MTREEIKNSVKSLLREQIGIHYLAEIKDDATIESLGMDFLDEIEFIMILEERFDICIPDDEAEKLTSISAIADLVWSMD